MRRFRSLPLVLAAVLAGAPLAAPQLALANEGGKKRRKSRSPTSPWRRSTR